MFSLSSQNDWKASHGDVDRLLTFLLRYEIELEEDFDEMQKNNVHHPQNPFCIPEADNQSVCSFSELEIHHYDHRNHSFQY